MKPINTDPAGVAIGDRVWIDMMKEHGIVRSLSRDGSRAVVEVNKISLNIAVSGLTRPRPVRQRDKFEKVTPRHPARAGGGRREIDMHGLRVEEMLSSLEQFLNDALLEGCEEVRVVHGHGSGALRKALHQHLKKMGLRNFRLGEIGQTPGGDGVTIVSL